MKTAVVTDSAANLDPKDIKKYNIHVVPITVIFGKQTYLENIDITANKFYKKLKTEKQLPTTSQITLGQMQNMYNYLAKKGYDSVISIHLSSGITTFFENLKAFIPNIKNIKIYPFDSKIASVGEADMALLAAKLIKQGKKPKEIIKQLKILRKTIKVYLVVNDLSHLVRTGRLSNASAFVGNILRVKPILTFKDGKIVVIQKERTTKRAYQFIKRKFTQDFRQANYPLRMAIVNANNLPLQKKWVQDIQQNFPKTPINQSELGPVIGVHVGPGTMAALWDRDWAQWPI